MRAPFGQIRSSSGRVLNLTPDGWINNEGENLNDAPLGGGSNALLAALSQGGQPAQDSAPVAGAPNKLAALTLGDFLEKVGAKAANKVDYMGKTGYLLADGQVAGMNPDGSTWRTQAAGTADKQHKAQVQAVDLATKIAALQKTQAEAGNVGASKVPPGYRPTADGGLEPIPGGPADLKLQGAFNQDTAALQGSQNSFDRLATAANEVAQHPGLGGITGLRGMLPNIPGSDAADAQAKLRTLTSQVGFGVLQEMRNNSKTGGALGAISDKENLMLQANLAALENAQSEKQMRESLQKIVEYASGAKDRLRAAYNLRHGGQQQRGAAPAAPAAGGTLPAVNAQGWQLHTDAAGNKAYVGPNGEIQEVR